MLHLAAKAPCLRAPLSSNVRHQEKTLFNRLRDFLLPAGHFRIAPPTRGLPRCKIRLLRDEDFDACEQIYLANERAHFPDGYFPRFTTWLRERRALILVAEGHGTVVGVCGISAQEQDGHHVAALSFGMVHPSLHKHGYGTALLLARLALLRTKKTATLVVLTTTGGSERFYKRFGFKHFHSLQPTPTYREDHYVARVTAKDRSRCLGLLRGTVSVSPELENEEVPPLSRLERMPSTVGTDA